MVPDTDTSVVAPWGDRQVGDRRGRRGDIARQHDSIDDLVGSFDGNANSEAIRWLEARFERFRASSTRRE